MELRALRAQLEAAEAEWREKFEARTIDWSEASNALYVWRHRAKDAEARAESAEAKLLPGELRKVAKRNLRSMIERGSDDRDLMLKCLEELS